MFIKGNALNKFKLDGHLLKLNSQIDADTEATQYSLKIEVVDGGPAPARTTTVSVAVDVTSIDDNVPVWETPTNGAYTTSKYSLYIWSTQKAVSQIFRYSFSVSGSLVSK